LKISCPSCEAKYSIGDDKVHNRLAKIRCRKCGANIVIDGRVDPPTFAIGESATAVGQAAQHAPAEASAPEYTVDFGETDQRSMSLGEIVAGYNEGYITAETYIWADGMTDWTPLAQVESIVDALNSAATGAVAPAMPAAGSSPRAASSPFASTAAETRAARTAMRAERADLFGGVAHVGSEEDVTTSVPQEPVAPTVSATGARNESSVLFSLAALTASAKPSTTSTRPLSSARTKRDDSGLIDLKALTAQAEQASESQASPGLTPIPLAGLGAPLGGGLGAPLGGGQGANPFAAAASLGDIAYPQQRSRMGLFIGGGIAVAALIIGLAIALRPSPPPEPAPAPTAAPILPASAAAVAEEEESSASSSSAKPPPTGTEEASAAPSSAPSVAKKTWRPSRSSSSKSSSSKSSSSSQSTKSTTTTKPATKKTSKCGCAPADLSCAMRCAAKGG